MVNRDKLIKKLEWGSLAVAFLMLLGLFIKSCNEHAVPKNPTQTRLEKQNDSLLKVLQHNIEEVKTLSAQLDSVDTLKQTIIERQSITNKTYRNAIYTILDAGYDDTSREYYNVQRKSDSLLKAGFYTRTIELRTAAE